MLINVSVDIDRFTEIIRRAIADGFRDAMAESQTNQVTTPSLPGPDFERLMSVVDTLSKRFT